MRNKKSNRAPAFTVVHFALILLCLVLVSTYATMGLHASYKSEATGTASARVAKFDVDVTGDSAAVEVHSSQTTDNVYTFTITNSSEVAVEYTLNLVPPNGIAGTFDKDTGTLDPLTGTATHELTLSVSDWDVITKDLTGQQGSVSLEFTVTVNVQQID